MANSIPILLEHGQGRRRVVTTVIIPSEADLAGAAQELRSTSDGKKVTYGQYGHNCVGVYYPPRTCSSTEVDPFTGVEGVKTTHPLDGYCKFYHCDGQRLTLVASAAFGEGSPTIHILCKVANEIQGGLFAEPEVSPRLEGGTDTDEVTRYERDAALRAACICHHGTRCAACGMDFRTTYGSVADGFIHVHHLEPLSTVGESHMVDPLADLVPLCPNCHAVAHMRMPPFTPSEIRDMRASPEE